MEKRSVLRPVPACPWWPYVWSQRANVPVGDDGQVPVGLQRQRLDAPPRSTVVRCLRPDGDVFFLLAVGEGLHEHDMSVLKRLKPSGLRHDVPKGTRVPLIYDKAGIDFGYWKRCQRECAVYFISRVKEGMVYDWLADQPVDPHDPRQRGVTADRHLMTCEGHPLRIIFYTDPATGQEYQFLANEPDLPPGLIAGLYRRRWDVEKVFDELKNKLGECRVVFKTGMFWS